MLFLALQRSNASQALRLPVSSYNKVGSGEALGRALVVLCPFAGLSSFAMRQFTPSMVFRSAFTSAGEPGVPIRRASTWQPTATDYAMGAGRLKQFREPAPSKAYGMMAKLKALF